MDCVAATTAPLVLLLLLPPRRRTQETVTLGGELNKPRNETWPREKKEAT